MFKYRLLAWLLIICLLIGCGENVTEVESEATHGETTHDEHDGEDKHDEDEADHHDEEHGEDKGHDEDEEHGDHDDEHDDHDESGLDAHEHGAAVLNITWDEASLAVELETPGYNLFGFEYDPSTDEEKAAVSDVVATLETGDFISFNESAGCALGTADIETGFGEDEADHHDEDEADHDDDHDEEVHKDAHVEYSFTCEQIESVTEIDLSSFFEQFPLFEELQVQWVSDTAQSAATATEQNNVISFQ